MTKNISIPTTMAINAPNPNKTKNLFWLLLSLNSLPARSGHDVHDPRHGRQQRYHD